MEPFEGKVALVTGGASGIGKAVVKEFLKRKIKVVFLDMNENAIAETMKEFQALYGKTEVIGFLCDVTDAEQFEKKIKETKSLFGRLDILINNAGILDEDNPKKMVDINLNAVITGTRLALNHLTHDIKERSGIVINTASVAGFLNFPVAPSYTAAKHGVLAYSQCMGDAEIVKSTNIKVNAICPDFTKTPLLLRNKDAVEAGAKLLGVEFFQPEDIAKGFLKILEDDVTGEALVVSLRKGMYYLPRNTSLDY